jgi:diaminopropionate ammonia-lyase
VPARIAAIRDEGAECIVVAGNYDDAVRHAADESARNGWQVIADTAYAGYLEIPGWIMAGYETIFVEAAGQMQEAGLPDDPGAVLLQAGVGGLAWAGTAFFLRRAAQSRPALIAVEPTDADRLLESLLSPDGSIRQAKGRQHSIMAGLNCGTPSLLAWPLLRAGLHFFLAIDDDYAAEAMRMLASCGVVSGESGAAGLAGLLALTREPSLAQHRAALRLDGASTVLVVNTEGATDPESYRHIVA